VSISPNVAVMTLMELRAREDAAYQRGVMRGRYEAALEASATGKRKASSTPTTLPKGDKE
jgi:hypothetical protein